MNAIGTNIGDARTWRCQNVEDTQKLLRGETVVIEWGATGARFECTAIDNNTLRVNYGSGSFDFKRAQ